RRSFVAFALGIFFALNFIRLCRRSTLVLHRGAGLLRHAHHLVGDRVGFALNRVARFADSQLGAHRHAVEALLPGRGVLAAYARLLAGLGAGLRLVLSGARSGLLALAALARLLARPGRRRLIVSGGLATGLR